jgi:capsular polysaccharide transport system ATP-binding protein
MIRLDNITKYYPSQLGNQYVFKGLSFDIPSNHNIGILGSNGAGKSTLFRLLAGSEYANSGRITTDVNLSWPVALTTGIHQQMTGQENTRFIGKINGIADLESYEERLAFACSIAIDFDVYLIDEVTSVGDAKFRRKAKQALLERSEQASIIMVSHEMDEIRQFCDSAIVLHNGGLTFYNDLEQGITEYQAL